VTTARGSVSNAQHHLAAKLLLVDDEPFNLDLLQQELEEFGFEIHKAFNGQQALDLVSVDPPDMIFLDLMMPVMDGFSVLKRLKADANWRSIPVVIVSASDDLVNIVRGIELGAADFLPKPFEPAILRARLQAGLEKKRLTDLEQRYLKSLERELEIGQEIQAGFLPSHIPEPAGWTLLAHFQAAREVAGDFYDVFEIGPDRLGLMLGDVTDKGVGSALYMALYRSLLRAHLLSDELSGSGAESACASPEVCLRGALTVVNRYICRTHDSAMLATVFLAIVDTKSGSLWYASAGHDSPFLLKRGAEPQQILPTGPVVGAIEAAVYNVGNLYLERGDCLVVYSDGIPDARAADGEMFGVDRLLGCLQGEQAPTGIHQAVIDAVNQHVGDAERYDDISLLVIGRQG